MQAVIKPVSKILHAPALACVRTKVVYNDAVERSDQREGGASGMLMCVCTCVSTP